MAGAMDTVSIYDLKAHLSEVVSRVERTGAGVVVTRHARPVAQIVPFPVVSELRPVGMWRGKVSAPDGWDEFTDQDAADWYGG
jgi:prevent-host-death family protein